MSEPRARPSRAIAAATVVPGSSAQGTWRRANGWPAHVSIHAHVLRSGKVLFWPGEDGPSRGGKSFQYAFVWDPVTETASESNNRKTNVFCSGHAFLPDGRLLVTGGHADGDGLGRSDVNIFDPHNNKWFSTTAMLRVRWYPTSTTLPSGDILAIGGSSHGVHTSEQVPTPEVRSASGSWRLLGGVNQVMPYYPWMFVAPNGQVFYAGPGEHTGYVSTTGAGGWTPVGQTLRRSSNAFASREYGSAVMYEPGKVLIVGGGAWFFAGNSRIQNPVDEPGYAGNEFAPTRTAEKIDLNQGGGWQPTGAMTFRRRHINATVLPDGRVLVTGGTASASHNDMGGTILVPEVWDPRTDLWTSWAPMPIRRLYHSTALLLPDGRILTAGGGRPAADGGDADHPDADVFSPPYLYVNDTLATRPRITGAPTVVSYGQPLQLQTPDAATVARVTWVAPGSVTHTFNQHQRFVPLTITARTASTLTVTAPASANVAPPGHYMVFLINELGVPSVARFVQVR